MTQRRVQSIADVAEDLMRDFEPALTVSTVTAVVMQLSKDGFISLEDLAHLARRHLEGLVSSARPEAPRWPECTA